MIWLFISASIVILLGLLLVIDSKIKGNKSIIVKISSFVILTFFLAAVIYFYGQSFLESFNINVKSLTNIKSFFSSRIVGLLAILLLCLFVFIKTIYVIIMSFNHKRVSERGEKVVFLIAVFFDIAVIPNIVIAGSFNILLVVPAIISIVETGLSLSKVVFSISYTPKLEGAMC